MVPEVVAFPFGVIALWIGLSLLVKAWRVRKSDPEASEADDARDAGRR
jgi:hypothetical protein